MGPHLNGHLRLNDCTNRTCCNVQMKHLKSLLMLTKHTIATSLHDGMKRRLTIKRDRLLNRFSVFSAYTSSIQIKVKNAMTRNWYNQNKNPLLEIKMENK